MNLLSVENISKRFGERLLFSELSFGLDKGQKVALVAKNGEGKTSLLEMLTGHMNPDSGQITWRNSIRVSYLRQTDNFEASKSIEDHFLQADNKYANAIREYEKAIEGESNKGELDKALANMQHLDAWNYEAKVDQLLKVFNLDLLPKSHLLGNLSGGQKKRIGLIQLILEEPDVFILDEPTNHLDIPMIEWLEDYLSAEDVSLILVSHDRYFLNRVCNNLIEIDQGRAFRYQGNYNYYLEKKAERQEIEAAEVSKAKNLYRKELEWMRRMPKARGTKSKARIDDFSGLEKKAKKRNDEEELKLEIKSERLGTKILELHHVSKSFGDMKIVSDFSYVFKRGEKIGIAGKNGVGKTTFLNLIMGKEELDFGKIVIGETVQFAYYTQKGIKLNEDKRIIDVVKDIAEVIPLAKGRKITASQLLERFLFPPKQQYSLVSKLSGGERKRLYLLCLLMANPNFLILDEPTNDLDIQTITTLEDFLQDYTGCLLIVSHDRAFMDHLSDHIFHFQGNGIIKDFNGTYSDLIDLERNKSPKVENTKEKEDKSEASDSESPKLNYQERKEYNKLEKEIEKLELKKENLLREMHEGLLSADELISVSQEVEKLEIDIEEKTMRWMELAERA